MDQIIIRVQTDRPADELTKMYRQHFDQIKNTLMLQKIIKEVIQCNICAGNLQPLHFSCRVKELTIFSIEKYFVVAPSVP